MNKSHVVEIIAILWLIAGLLASGWIRWVFFSLAIENTLESMYHSFKYKQARDRAKEETI